MILVHMLLFHRSNNLMVHLFSRVCIHSIKLYPTKVLLQQLLSFTDFPPIPATTSPWSISPPIPIYQAKYTAFIHITHSFSLFVAKAHTYLHILATFHICTFLKPQATMSFVTTQFLLSYIT